MAEKSKFWYLKHFNLFDGMDEESMLQVDRIAAMSSAKAQQPIYFPDAPSSAVFFLKEGHVKISRISGDGKEMILDVLGPGELFGELSMTEQEGARNEMAQALDEAVICTVRKEDFESMLRSNPGLNVEVTRRVGLRLRKFEERVVDLMFKDVRTRIATFLVRYAEELGKMKSGQITIRMHLSHQDIAFLTGAARQTVTTTLNEFRSMCLLDFSRSEIVIKQYDRLRALAK